MWRREKGSVAVTNLLGSDIIDNGNGNYTVPENAEVTILATPLEGYEFSGWKVGNTLCDFTECGTALNTNDNPLTITMTKDTAFMADFAAVAPQPAATVVTITEADFPTDGSQNSFTKDGVTITTSSSFEDSHNLWYPTFTSSVGNFTKIEISAGDVALIGEGWSGGNTWTGNASSVSTDGDSHVFVFYGSITITCTIEPAAPTAVENVQTNQVQGTKFFRDGQLLIEKNGKIYNATGAEVR